MAGDFATLGGGCVGKLPEFVAGLFSAEAGNDLALDSTLGADFAFLGAAAVEAAFDLVAGAVAGDLATGSLGGDGSAATGLAGDFSVGKADSGLTTVAATGLLFGAACPTWIFSRRELAGMSEGGSLGAVLSADLTQGLVTARGG
jgi:hypothetical protein